VHVDPLLNGAKPCTSTWGIVYGLVGNVEEGEAAVVPRYGLLFEAVTSLRSSTSTPTTEVVRTEDFAADRAGGNTNSW